LFQLLCSGTNTGDTISGITVQNNNSEAYFVAYDDGNAYLYHANSGNNTTISAGEVQLIGVINGITAGALVAKDAILN
jgi:hypothetical protein